MEGPSHPVPEGRIENNPGEAKCPPGLAVLQLRIPEGRPNHRCEMPGAKTLLGIALVLTCFAPILPAQSTPAPKPAHSTQSPKSQEQTGMGGIASAGTCAPGCDAQKRPITAG